MTRFLLIALVTTQLTMSAMADTYTLAIRLVSEDANVNTIIVPDGFVFAWNPGQTLIGNMAITNMATDGQTIITTSSNTAKYATPASLFGDLLPVVPAGIIVMWSGTLATVPAGWALCMTGDSEITLANGDKRSIAQIVNGRESVDVMAFNSESGLLEPRRVVDWFVNKSTRNDFVRLKIARGNSALGKKRSLDVTLDHPVWIVGKGWVKAVDVPDGSKVLMHQPMEGVSFTEIRPTPQYVKTVKIVNLSKGKRNSSRFHYRYDIKVEGLASFVANGFIVHNCNGTQGTPDLRDKFIKGWAQGVNPGGTGGAASNTPSGSISAPTFTGTPFSSVINHTHSVTVTDPGHAHLTQRYPTATGGSSGFTIDTSMSGTLADNTQPVKTNTTGITASTANPAGGVASITPAGSISAPAFTGVVQSNEPEFFRLAFIQKLP